MQPQQKIRYHIPRCKNEMLTFQSLEANRLTNFLFVITYYMD